MVKAKQTWTITDHNELSNTLLHTKTEGEPVVSIVSSRSDHPLRFLWSTRVPSHMIKSSIFTC